MRASLPRKNPQIGQSIKAGHRPERQAAMIRIRFMLVRRAPWLVALTAVTVAVAVGVGLWGWQDKVPQKQVPNSQASEAAHASPHTVAGKRVLLVHSYHPEYPWVASITEGVREGLQGSEAVLEILYMDTKRRTDEEWKVRAGQLAQQKVEQWSPDVVIAADDNAQQYFVRGYVGESLPIVFCGVNQDPSKYGYPASNVTGVLERPNLKEAVQFLAGVRPVRRIALLSDDCQTSVGALNFMKNIPVDVEIVDVRIVSDFEDWKSAIRQYNDQVDALGIYMYHTIKRQGEVQSMEPRAVMEWTSANVTIPTFGFFDFAIADGVALGLVESGGEHGYKAAQYALWILHGTPLAALPVIRANRGQKMANRAAAARVGLALPEPPWNEVTLVAGE